VKILFDTNVVLDVLLNRHPHSVMSVGVDGIVTRNLGDFALAKIPVYSPDELETLLNAKRT